MLTRVVVRSTARDGSRVELSGLVRSATQTGAELVAEQIFEQLRLFAFEHLPPALQAYSRPFGELARALVERASPWSFELVESLRLLKLAKDAGVRAQLAAADVQVWTHEPDGAHDETQS